MPIKVLLADDTDFMRRAIRGLLEIHPHIEVVGEAANFNQTIQMSKDLKPHVIVMDLRMPDETAVKPFEVKSLLKPSGSKLLAVSIWNDAEAAALAESFGAVSLLDKANLAETLVPAIVQLAPPNVPPTVQ